MRSSIQARVNGRDLTFEVKPSEAFCVPWFEACHSPVEVTI